MAYEVTCPQNQVTVSVGQKNVPNMEYTYSLFLKIRFRSLRVRKMYRTWRTYSLSEKYQVSLSSGERNVPSMEYVITFPQNQVTLSVGQENVPDMEYTYSLY